MANTKLYTIIKNNFDIINSENTHLYDFRSCTIEFLLLNHFHMYNNVIFYELC